MMTFDHELSCDAVLFDLDGVLVDSLRSVERAWTNWAAARGLDPERTLRVAHGRRTVETLGLLAPELDAESETKELERREIREASDLSPIPGAAALLDALPARSWTVVTSGTRELATARLRGSGLPAPPEFVSADDVSVGKPDPECYLAGARLLGVEPERCVVFEDAVSGITAARDAGMTAVALETTYPAGELSAADFILRDLRDVSLSTEKNGTLRITLRRTPGGSQR